MSGVTNRLAIVLAIGTLGLALLLSLSTSLLPLFGYQATVISGGSMEPTIHNGALAVSQPVTPESLQVGDIITYRRPGAEASVTHRIIGEDVVNGEQAFTTKGDSNATADPVAISLASETQRVVFTLPYAGFAMDFLHSLRGMLLLTALPGLGLAMLFVLGMGKQPEAEEAATA
jgi:signal peptidase